MLEHRCHGKCFITMHVTSTLTHEPPVAPEAMENVDSDIHTDFAALRSLIEVERRKIATVDSLLACFHAHFEADLDYAAHQLDPPEVSYVICTMRQLLKDCLQGLDTSKFLALWRASLNARPVPPPAVDTQS